jgi:hypothetical protein
MKDLTALMQRIIRTIPKIPITIKPMEEMKKNISDCISVFIVHYTAICDITIIKKSIV